jgi:photosystem II stability/assembly factor-like uncharacterized protein
LHFQNRMRPPDDSQLYETAGFETIDVSFQQEDIPVVEPRRGCPDVGQSGGAEEVRRLTLPGQVAGNLDPLQDDATLHDVALVGRRTGWAVGDRGMVWKSGDAGRSWEPVSIAEELREYALHSVCFLTDRIGWIAGGTVARFGRTHVGLVLFTEDGGETWTPRGPRNLPYLKQIRFFDMQRGLAVGAGTPTFPGGVLITEDGGETWQPAGTNRVESWNAAAFFSFEEGVVAGDRGEYALAVDGVLHPGRSAPRGLPGLLAASADASGRAWMAGEGATLLTSSNRGVFWSLPDEPLPVELADFFDFHCVSHVNDHVWVAGSPGSVIWHSLDGGASWTRQATGNPAPLRAIHFADERHGVAVGAFGRICVTDDGGITWTNVRGHETGSSRTPDRVNSPFRGIEPQRPSAADEESSGRRLASLLLHTHADQVNLEFVTRWAKTDGYRTGVLLATRRDVGADAHAAEDLGLRLHQSVMAAGGNVSRIDWRLPLALPNLERNSTRLEEEWSLLTDQRFTKVLLGNLVGQIRTWRPSLILVNEPGKRDAATRMIQQAVLHAVEQAGDPSMYPEQMNLGGLSPWKVRKVIAQRPAGREGAISQDPWEVLPRLGTTLDVATAEAEARLREPVRALPERQDYVVLMPDERGTFLPEERLKDREADAVPLARRTLFHDLRLSPGSAARRELPAMSPLDYDTLIEQARQRRTMTAIGRKMTRGDLRGGQLLGQLQEFTRKLSREQAARQLADLAADYRRQGEWGLAEAVYAELITHYADQPVAIEAMLWLTQFWTSAEMNWQRLRALTASNTQTRFDAAIVQSNVRQAIEIVQENVTETGRNEALRDLPSPRDRQVTPQTPTIGRLGAVLGTSGEAGSQHQMLLTRWQEMAALLTDGLSEAYPRLAENPEFQFVTASLMRRRGQNRRADEIYDRFLSDVENTPWRMAARGESFLIRPAAVAPKPVLSVKRAQAPPVLDGELFDACWAQAQEIRLRPHQASGGRASPDNVLESGTGAFVGPSSPGRVTYAGPEPIVLFAYDDEYLYVGARVPIHEDLPDDPPQLPGRERDADLSDYDRISFQFDIDRDYATYYQFEVDQRGWTRESCWGNLSYDPDWYVAAKRSGNAWQIECAIPLEHLLPPGRVQGSTWAVGVTRIMPGIGVASWTGSGGEVPHPPLFGLLRFE